MLSYIFTLQLRYFYTHNASNPWSHN